MCERICTSSSDPALQSLVSYSSIDGTSFRVLGGSRFEVSSVDPRKCQTVLIFGMRPGGLPPWFSRSLLVQPIVSIYFHGSPTAEPVLCRQYQGFSSTDMPSHGGAELQPHSDG